MPLVEAAAVPPPAPPPVTLLPAGFVVVPPPVTPAADVTVVAVAVVVVDVVVVIINAAASTGLLVPLFLVLSAGVSSLMLAPTPSGPPYSAPLGARCPGLAGSGAVPTGSGGWGA